MPKAAKLALFIVTLVFFVSLISPYIGLLDPNEINLDAIRQAPSMSHPFGTDNKGRDLFARVIAGAKVSIGVAFSASTVAASLGLTVGLMAGYLGGKVDRVLMTLVDFILSFPSLLFAIAVSIVLPSGLFSVMIAIAAVGWTSFARLVRGIVLSVKDMPYVDAARTLGCSDLRILVRHIAPQCITGVIVMMGIKLGGFILTEATLGFLGLGLQPPQPSWGAMVSAGRNHILTAPWMALFPGLAIFLTVLCLNMLGESLRKAYQMTE
jgi:peptide/nickel transport system permease protein